MDEFYILNLFGLLAFSIYGAHIAINKKFDIGGILVCSCVTCLGGGTIRDLMLNKTPFYFIDYNYLIIIFIGSFLAIITYLNFNKIKKYLLIVDSIGLCSFTIVGAQIAHQANMGYIGIVILAVITAVGGGILRDMLIDKIPEIFYRDLYMTPTLIIGILYASFIEYTNNKYFIYLLFFIGFSIRLYAIHNKVNLFIPYKKMKIIN